MRERALRTAVGAIVSTLVAVSWLALASTTGAGAGIGAGGARQTRQVQPPAAEIDKIFAEWDRPDSPGCALAVISDGRIVYEKGYGAADLEHDVRIGPETVFYIGSVSKQFTAAAAALAIQGGKLKLDEDIRRLIPELPDYGRPITARHLVHHTSGLRDIYAILSAAGRRDQDAFDNDAVLRIVARQKALNFMPGDEHLYSNSGYTLLALLVERATGMPFSDYAEEKIFRPLGMTASHFSTDLSRMVRHRAYGYERGRDGRIRLNTPVSERAGAGGMFSSVRDLAKWDQNFYDGRVGGLDLIEQLETPGKLNDGKPLTYAWGLTRASYRGLPIVEHGGSLGGYRSHLIRFRNERFSVVCLCNMAGIAPGTLARRVADLYLGDRMEPLPAPRQAQESPSRPPAASYEERELEEFAGTYASEELESTWVIRAEGGRLTARRGVQRQVVTLQPGPSDEFTVSGQTIRFVRDSGRRVVGFTVDAGRARGMRFDKVTASS